MPTPPLRLPLARARLALVAAQGLASPAAAPLPTLERTGFVRTLGGVEAYLALRARVHGLRAATIHEAIDAGAARVIPAVRGCMYLVAGAHVPAALGLAASLNAPRFAKDRAKAGIRPGEIEKLGSRIVDLLRRTGPLGTDAVKRALPDGSVRSLGARGKKAGLSSTLPLALRLLELAGRIDRTPEGGRLDHERYLWRVARPKPIDGNGRPSGRTDPLERIAEVFLRAAGLGTPKDFAGWAGVSRRDAVAAFGRLDTVPVEVDGVGPRVTLEESRDLLSGAGAAADAIAFLPFEDNLVALQGTPAILVGPDHRGLKVPSFGSGAKTTLGAARHLSYRPVVAEGKLVGFWEFDPDSKRVVFACFDAVSAVTRKRLEDEAARVAVFLATEIGHGRSYSLDTDDELRRRAAWIRGLADAGRAGKRSASAPVRASKRRAASGPARASKRRAASATARASKRRAASATARASKRRAASATARGRRRATR